MGEASLQLLSELEDKSREVSKPTPELQVVRTGRQSYSRHAIESKVCVPPDPADYGEYEGDDTKPTVP